MNLGWIVRLILCVVAWNLIPDSAHWYPKLIILALAALQVELKWTPSRT